MTAYAGLAPAVRQSAGKGKELGITKEGSPLVRWALVEAAWRVVRHSAAWRRIYEGIKKRGGGKKTIVAVARRLLCVRYAMLRDGTNYHLLKVGEAPASGKAGEALAPGKAGEAPAKRKVGEASAPGKAGEAPAM